MLGKTEGESRRRRQRVRWSNSITDSMDVKLNKLLETVEAASSLQPTVSAESQTGLSDRKTTTN